MKILLVTDAWMPQVNGVVTTLVELVRELEILGHSITVIHPGLFDTRPCPGYAGIDLAVRPAKRLAELLENVTPDAVHLATEGPLGWAARRYCLRRGWRFSTAYHTRFPELLKAALRIPLWAGYAVFRHFHRASSSVMVPTAGVMDLLHQRRFSNLRRWAHGVDLSLFLYSEKPHMDVKLGNLSRPISLFVGRLSYEKNIEAFLQLQVPGTKVVCGVGPLEAELKSKYPEVVWVGLLSRVDLASIYRAADVFVMSSRTETFGLVMLEAMASGTPVAGFPVEGPQEVLGNPARGGALSEDLRDAWKRAIAVPRQVARSRAQEFSWHHAAMQFANNLVAARTDITLAPHLERERSGAVI